MNVIDLSMYVVLQDMFEIFTVANDSLIIMKHANKEFRCEVSTFC